MYVDGGLSRASSDRCWYIIGLEFPWASERRRHASWMASIREASVSVMRDRPHQLISGSVAFDRDHNPAFLRVYEAETGGTNLKGGN